MKVGLGHLILALAGLGSLSGLAATHVLSSSDAFTGIMSILVGGGVVAGMVVGSNNTPAPAPTPPPAPQSPPPLPPAP